MPLNRGARVGPYEVLALIGAGGMGEVYRARDPRLGRELALKILPAEFASDAERRGRFEREARAASALNHPNIVTIHELGSADGVLYAAMELIEGETLRQLQERGAVSTKKLLEIAAQVGDGLAKAHAAGIVHRDLKPENVMISSDGFVKILDFGLAKLGRPEGTEDSKSPTLTQTGAVLGTLTYMSPEQASGRAVDFRSDQFALGSMLYEMAAGQHPFRCSSMAETLAAVIRDEPVPLARVSPKTPPPLAWIVERCLAKDPTERYASTLDLARELRSLREHLSEASEPTGRAPQGPRRGAAWVALAAVLVLALAVGTGWYVVHHRARVRWARQTALPQIQHLVNAGKYAAALKLVREAEQVIPDDALLLKLKYDSSVQTDIRTTPAGVDVFIADYATPQGPWEPLGRTPLMKVTLPWSVVRWRFEKQGYQTIHAALPQSTFWDFEARKSRPLEISLDPEGRWPAEMAHIPGQSVTLWIPGLENLPPVTIDDFLMDRYEVTNREFKKFVDAGGYRDRRYWQQEFVKSGKGLSFDEAMTLFRDRLGRPGPATWALGTYVEGRADHPVTGVSWYEAAAYAEFAGKRLPTLYHWNFAAPSSMSEYIVPLSNVGGKELAPVGTYPGLTSLGLYDMAGNAKEWCWNESNLKNRYVVGGAWDEQPYMFVDPDARDPFDRRANIGFRCIRLITDRPLEAKLLDPVPWPVRDFAKETPASDAEFRILKRLYSYDKTDLAARPESTDDSVEEWRIEKVSYAAAYGAERILAYLFLPKRAKPPYQTVVYFPGSNAINTRSSDEIPRSFYAEYVVRSGRALLYPIYKSTYERGDEIKSDYQVPTSQYRDHVIAWSKDLGRSIDYLETRPDVDRAKLAFLGLSWGATIGPVLVAVEDRIKVAVLAEGGLDHRRTLPEVEPVNFAPRIRIPVLMVNGRYDFFYPVETSQLPLFRLLGSPEKDKRHMLFEAAHNVPTDALSREVLDWLDRYLGPVR